MSALFEITAAMPVSYPLGTDVSQSVEARVLRRMAVLFTRVSFAAAPYPDFSHPFALTPETSELSFRALHGFLLAASGFSNLHDFSEARFRKANVPKTASKPVSGAGIWVSRKWIICHL